MEFTPDMLLSRLRLAAGTSRVVVAYSGGMDSTVLLEALAQRRYALPPLAAVHIDHGIHPDSARWVEHCAARCKALDIPLESYGVSIDASGQSLEAAAREARYDVFHDFLQANEVLLTAQHQDDQLETFLLQALRGAGPAGLAAMPVRAPLGEGTLLRPLLDFDRAMLAAWAQEQGLEWIDDPSNVDESINRNYLRRRVVPVLKERWPAAAQTLSRAARNCAEAGELLETLATADLERSSAPIDCLSVDLLLPLPESRRKNVLREWLHLNGLRMPSASRLEHVLQEVIAAAPDAMPVVEVGGAELRRYRGHLYIVRSMPEPSAGQWQGGVFELGEGLGWLEWLPAEVKADSANQSAGSVPEPGALEVRYRLGGERLQPAGRKETHDLKKLFQDAGVLPWQRGRIPLLYADAELVAVGDLWHTAGFSRNGGPPLAWRERPRVFAENSPHFGE